MNKPSAWDVGYAFAMAIACLLSYEVITELPGFPFEGHRDSIAGIWAAVSTAFVFRDTRQRSLSTGVGRLIATFVSFALCLPTSGSFRRTWRV